VVLIVTATGVLLSGLDLLIVNVALPKISTSFGHASLPNLSWILNAYAIVYAALLVPAGRLGDRSGNKAMFLSGLTIFVVGSGLCATVPNLGLLIMCRVLQAVGGAMMIPSSLGLVLAATPLERRATAVRVWVAFGGLGAILGPVLGGLLVELSWRWIFLINLPIGLITLLVGLRLLPNPAGVGGQLPDLRGAVLLMASIASLVTGLVKGNDWGWTSVAVLGLFAATIVLAVAFAISSKRHSSPLIDPSLLRIPSFNLMAVNSLLFSAAFGALVMSITLSLQQLWGWSALRTGLAIAPGPVVVPIVAVLVGAIIARIGPGLVIGVGGLVCAMGLGWWALSISLHANYLGAFFGGLLLCGIGIGLSQPPAFAAGTSALPAQQFATGSAVLIMARQVGIAIGISVLVAVVGTPATPHAVLQGFQHGWWATAVISVLAGLVGLPASRTLSG